MRSIHRLRWSSQVILSSFAVAAASASELAVASVEHRATFEAMNDTYSPGVDEPGREVRRNLVRREEEPPAVQHEQEQEQEQAASQPHHQRGADDASAAGSSVDVAKSGSSSHTKQHHHRHAARGQHETHGSSHHRSHKASGNHYSAPVAVTADGLHHDEAHHHRHGGHHRAIAANRLEVAEASPAAETGVAGHQRGDRSASLSAIGIAIGSADSAVAWVYLQARTRSSPALSIIGLAIVVLVAVFAYKKLTERRQAPSRLGEFRVDQAFGADSAELSKSSKAKQAYRKSVLLASSTANKAGPQTQTDSEDDAPPNDASASTRTSVPPAADEASAQKVDAPPATSYRERMRSRTQGN